MANIPKYSPSGRAALEKQVAEYQSLLDKMLLENPAFKAQAPIVLGGKSETETSEDVTRNPGPNDPGGTTKKHSKTTNEPQQVFAPTTAEDAVRKRFDELNQFINQARLDLADEAALANRLPISTEEALDIASGQISGSPEAKTVKRFSDLLGVKGMGSPSDRAQEMLLRGAAPQEGFTFLRSLLPGARSNPRLLAEMMFNLNTATGTHMVPFAQLQTDFADAAGALTPDAVRSSIQQTAPGSAKDVARFASTSEGKLAGDASAIPGYERGLASLSEAAQTAITKNRQKTLAGALVAGIGAGMYGTRKMWGSPDEADKFNKDAAKFLFGAGGPDAVRLGDKNQYSDALNDAMRSYITREFGDDKSAKRKAYMSLVGKHAQTIGRIGEGTLKPDDTDEGYKALIGDLSSFYSGNSYNQGAPIMLPYGDKKKPGILAIDKSGKKFNRLRGADFEAIND